MNQLKYAWKVLKKAAAGFDSDNCFRYAAALSFYTLFSLAPVVLISVHAMSFIAKDVNFQQQITNQFSRLMGERGAEGIVVLLDSLQNQQQSTFQLIASIVVLIFTATNIFIQLQGAFNDIYNVRPKKGKALLKQVIDRLISLGMILSLGLVVIVSLVLDSVVVALKNYLSAKFESISVLAVTILENLVLVGLVMLIIYGLFQFLPDVKIKRKFKWKGSFIISVLLLLGKFGISWYIGNSRFSELGGASASVIILMLWVYYSSLILFIGAELIKGMSQVSGVYMPATHYAVRVKSVLIDKNGEDDKEEKNDDGNTEK